MMFILLPVREMPKRATGKLVAEVVSHYDRYPIGSLLSISAMICPWVFFRGGSERLPLMTNTPRVYRPPPFSQTVQSCCHRSGKSTQALMISSCRDILFPSVWFRKETLPRHYIYAKKSGPGDVFRQFAERAKSDSGWKYYEIDASHNPHITCPDALMALLTRIMPNKWADK